MKIERHSSDKYILEGVVAACMAMRLSYNSESKGPEADLSLLQRLVVAGPSHGKALRMVNVVLDITAPRFWWSEFDTYKVGTVALSESTMHTLGKRMLTEHDFEEPVLYPSIAVVNGLIAKNEPINVIKAHLPEGFLQRRMVSLNYQVLRTMYFDRRNHKLPQWRQFCEFVEGLSYSGLIVGEGMPE